jgi:hypothetical protein
MWTTCNPGRFLEVAGSFALVPGVLARPVVVDRESNLQVDLGELLTQFLEDPSETITGPIKIRITAASS